MMMVMAVIMMLVAMVVMVMVIMVVIDNFRRNDHSGWAKAGWTVFVIFLPLIGVLVYIGTRPHMFSKSPA